MNPVSKAGLCSAAGDGFRSEQWLTVDRFSARGSRCGYVDLAERHELNHGVAEAIWLIHGDNVPTFGELDEDTGRDGSH